MFVFHYSNPKLTALLLLHSKLHEYDLPYQPSQSQWGLGLGEIRQCEIIQIQTVTRCYPQFHASGCTRNGIFQCTGTSPTLEQCMQGSSSSHIKIRSVMCSVNFDEKLKILLHLTLQLHKLQTRRRNWLATHCSEIGGVQYL